MHYNKFNRPNKREIVSGNQPLLRVNNLSKSFDSVEALVGINFELEPGEVLGVVGQRGSGKSTLFRLLSGVYTPTSGEIVLDGKRAFFRAAFQRQAAWVKSPGRSSARS